MSRLFNRAYQLIIIPQEGEAKSIKDLRINFEITKSVLSFPNLARIAIYNPNEDTLSLLQDKFTEIVFNAGYFGNLKLLFKGDIRNVFQNRSGVDTIVTIYAGDGERSWQNSIFNKTFTENISISNAIKEVLESFKELTIGEINGIPELNNKLRGQVLSGSSKDILNNFAKEYGFDWSIQDGEIIITPTNEALTDDEAVLIRPETGMIGSPTITEIGADVSSLLNPNLLPNRAFKIESANVNVQLGNLFFRNVRRTTAEGFYKIQEATFKGDSREGDWLVSVKGRTLNV